VRPAELRLGGRSVAFELRGAVNSKRLHRRECLWTMWAAGALGGASLHPTLRTLREATVLVDISGGDSFSDIYGRKGFATTTLPKRIATRAGVPLVLLPQTYGPFLGRRAVRSARAIVRSAAMAWARDAHSHAVLTDLLGSRFDARRHRATVDVAFLLPAVAPERVLPDPLARWLSSQRENPTVGINVSGLIYKDPRRAAQEFGFRAAYGDVLRRFVDRLLAETGVNVVLIPHVVAPRGHYESDLDACESLVQHVGGRRDRIVVAPALAHPGEAKWLISRCDWFCGTRMHATIAALSSGVPTCAIAYSPKTLGVFETCGQAGEVVDPRAAGTVEVTDGLWTSWQRRAQSVRTLRERLPAVFAQASTTMDELATFIEQCASASRSRGAEAAVRRA